MPGHIKYGTFTGRSGTGSQAITGIGFQPTGLIVWGSLTGSGAPAFLWSHFGISDAALTQYGRSTAENDETNPPISLTTVQVTTAFDTARILIVKDYTGAVQEAAALTSFDADGFTLDWTTNLLGGTFKNYIAFGGVVETKAVLPTVPSGSTQAITGAGFAPTAAIGWIRTGDTAGVAQASIGLAAAGSDQVAAIASTRTAGTSDAGDAVRLQYPDAFLIQLDAAGAITGLAAVSSFDADGITLEWSTSPISVDAPILFIGGIPAQVGTIVQLAAASGPQVIDGLDVKPEGVIFVSANAVASLTPTRDNQFTIGAADPAGQGSTWAGSIDAWFEPINAKYFPQSARSQSTNRAIALAQAGTGGPTPSDGPWAALTGLAGVSSFDADGFTLEWDASDINAREIAYLAFGFTPIVLTPSTLPGGDRQEGYLELVTATGGTGVPFVFDVSAGSLPPGLTLDAGGLIHGTPTSAGAYTVTIRATDGDGNTGTRAYTLNVAGLRIVIDGEDVTAEVAAAEIELTLNRQATARLVIGDGYIPEREKTALIYARDGITPIFGGIVLSRRVQGMSASNPANQADVDLVDNSIFFDDADVTLVSAVTQDLEDVIAEIVAQSLAVYGITYTPTATGKTVPPIQWIDISVTEAFKRITDATGVVFRVLPLKDLDVFVPLDDAAPVSITDATINAFDLSWSDPPNLPRNTVDLLCGPSGNGVSTARWTVEAPDTSWEVDIQAAIGGWQQGYVTEIGSPNVNRTVSTPADGNGYYFWDETNGRGTISIGIGSAPPDGTVIEFNYTAVFPFHAKVSIGSPPAPPITFREAHPEIVVFADGMALAAQILAREGADPIALEVTTDVDGFLPGQGLDVDTTYRGGLVALFLVSTIRITLVNAELWEYQIDCEESEEYTGGFVEQWKALTSGSSSAASSAPAPLPDSGAGVAGDVYTDGRNAFRADQSMGSHKLRFVQDPASAQDAATKASQDAGDAATLAAAATASEAYADAGDAATLATVAGDHYIKRDGSVAFTGAQSMGSHKLTDVTDPTSAQDAATKAYVDAGGGGSSGLVLVEQHTVAGAAAINFTTGITSAYDSYVLELLDILPATNGALVKMHVSTNGGSSYDTGTNYATSYTRWSKTGQSVAGAASDSDVDFGGLLGVSNDATEQGLSAILKFFNPLGTAGWKKILGQSSWWYQGTPELLGTTFAAAYKSATAVNALRVIASTGNLSGTARLYGVAK